MIHLILVPILLIFAAYLLFSLFLFFFPQILHRPHSHPRMPLFTEVLAGEKVLNIAHRGGPRLKTENTI